MYSTKPSVGQFAVTATSTGPNSSLKARFVAWAIRAITRSKVNHAILCVGPDGTCVEADPKGAQYTHVSHYPHAVWSSLPLTAAQAAGVAEWGISKIGTPYSYRNCAYIGFVKLFGWAPAFMVRRLASLDDLMCSQLVDAAEHFGAGLELFTDKRPAGAVSPEDLAEVIAAGHPL